MKTLPFAVCLAAFACSAGCDRKPPMPETPAPETPAPAAAPAPSGGQSAPVKYVRGLANDLDKAKKAAALADKTAKEHMDTGGL